MRRDNNNLKIKQIEEWNEKKRTRFVHQQEIEIWHESKEERKINCLC